jgi:arabinogalactan endo-1,4-beta-galactosidase
LGWSRSIPMIYLGTGTALLPGYDASPAGQLRFLTDLRSVIAAVPNHHGMGFCLLGASLEWLFGGNAAANGSPWENLALFDFNNKALVALRRLCTPRFSV